MQALPGHKLRNAERLPESVGAQARGVLHALPRRGRGRLRQQGE